MSAHTQRVNAAQAARAQSQLDLEDVERGNFLNTLDCASFEVTDFEAAFIESFASWLGDARKFWTPRRREVVDEMRKKYGGRL